MSEDHHTHESNVPPSETLKVEPGECEHGQEQPHMVVGGRDEDFESYLCSGDHGPIKALADLRQAYDDLVQAADELNLPPRVHDTIRGLGETLWGVLGFPLSTLSLSEEV